MSLTIGSLFSGIGGLELGLSWGLGGAETLWQAEMDPFASAVLARHWPDARRLTDVRHINGQSVPRVDLICGGFPCQPHSVAGKRESSNDERDLWSEFARIIGDVRPRWVVAENVPGLLSSADPAHGRGKGGFFLRVLRNLAEMGFDAEWGTFPAAAVGAHHKRDRVFLVAYASGAGLSGGEHERSGEAQHAHPTHGGAIMADASSAGCEEQHASALAARAEQRTGGRDALGHPTGAGLPNWAGGALEQPSPLTQSERSGRRNAQPGVCGVVDGLPPRVAALRTLGNAVVPQQAAVIGRAIRDAEAHRRAYGMMPERLIRPEHFGGVA